MSRKSLYDHVDHSERLLTALIQIAERAGYLADSLAGPAPEKSDPHQEPPKNPGLLGELGGNLDGLERECVRVAAALSRIGDAVKQSEKNAAQAA